VLSFFSDRLASGSMMKAIFGGFCTLRLLDDG
jgi:hypothetical protein